MEVMELTWLAGLIEGEGSFYRDKSRDYIYIKVAMVDEDVIEKCYRITGIGTLNNHKQGDGQRMYRWVVSKQVEVVTLMLALYPHMGSRRQEKIRELLKLWRGRLEEKVSLFPDRVRDEYYLKISQKFTES